MADPDYGRVLLRLVARNPAAMAALDRDEIEGDEPLWVGDEVRRFLREADDEDDEGWECPHPGCRFRTPTMTLADRDEYDVHMSEAHTGS